MHMQVVAEQLMFQSTLPRRERPLNVSELHAHIGFQSTLPRRERHSVHGIYCTLYNVSIHAPTKGATPVKVYIYNDWRFQSTLPRRERPFPADNRNWDGSFNPRSHEGSDRFLYDLRHIHGMFQSTLPRRERRHIV